MKHYYLAGLCAVSALWALNFWAPGPPLGVSTTPERVRILGYDRELFGGWLPSTKDTVRAAQTTPMGLADPYSGLHNPRPWKSTTSFRSRRRGTWGRGVGIISARRSLPTIL